MTTSDVALEGDNRSVQARTEMAGERSIAFDRSQELQGTYRIYRIVRRSTATRTVILGDYYLAASSSDTIAEQSDAAAPDDDLTADEWELAKAAAMKTVAHGLEAPDDFLAYVRARISNI